MILFPRVVISLLREKDSLILQLTNAPFNNIYFPIASQKKKPFQHNVE